MTQSTARSAGANVFESRLGGVTVRGQAHSLSAWFVLALRLMMGYAFLHSGLDKVLSGSFSAGGYLGNVASTNGNPLEWMFAWMANTPVFLDFVNVAVPFGETLIGLALIVGVFTRLAAFWGAFMMLMFYFGNWGVEHGYVNGDFAYMLVFLAVAAFGAGRILGLDGWLEDTDFVANNAWLRYLLG
ncbi:DoxX family protein [Halobacterium bonnevillei]|uniref:DoxX family membrane protein n=1 Tax=Halobacterium bonnevillei TaxID=2692200 RepID=A0A6B0SNM1_9EURY|nr:DoxX family protein [Halobacterium bonnevillei]MXR20440.1 DoxX family membrane protein [Halobacterium bonnevillei]